MKSISIISLLFFILYRGYCQENYIIYNREILNCETRFLFFENIKEALVEYDSVFRKYKKPFAKDCFIALQLACFANDKEHANSFFALAFSRGVSWIAVKSSPPIKRFFDENPAYEAEIKKVYEKQYTRYKKLIRWDLRDTLLRMKRVDDSLKWLANSSSGKASYFYDSIHRATIPPLLVFLTNNQHTGNSNIRTQIS